MENQWSCLQCGGSIGMWDMKCCHCGTNQFRENNEYAPTPQSDAMARKLVNKNNIKNKRKYKRSLYTEEERLALELYPKDEGYKLSLISRIFGKK